MFRTHRSARPPVIALLLLVLALCFVDAFGFGPGIGPSEARAEESWGYDLGHELMSPYCPGRTLATCPSPQAAELVQWIVAQEAAGATQEQVIEMLVDRFGEDILGTPPAEGFTLWAYILPVIGFALGGGIVVLVLWRVVRGGAASDDPSQPLAAGSGSANRTAASDAIGIDSDEELARLVDRDLQHRA